MIVDGVSEGDELGLLVSERDSEKDSKEMKL